MSIQLNNTARPPRRRGVRLAAALLFGCSLSTVAAFSPAHAQEVDASLRGTITLNEGESAQSVTATEVNTGFKRTVEVREGAYNFASLRPGTYQLTIDTGSGVRTTDSFRLTVAQNAVLDFNFADEDIAAGGEIVVSGTRLRSMEGGEVGVNISQRLIEQLPQNNRNFLAFADLAPGVQFITNGSDQSRIQGGAMNSNSVNVFIDGIGQKDYVLKNGITGQDSTQGNPFPQLAVAEYRVLSSNYKAEFDQVMSVAITAVTKSGTNEFHGSGFVDFTNQSLRDARPIELVPGKVKSRDLQFGGSLGGPIIKDVMHFFATYEGKRRINPRDVTPGLSLPVSFFPAAYQGYFGPTNETFDENLYFGKVDFSPTDRDLIEVSAKFRDESGETFNSGINAYETRTIARVKEWRGLARWQHTADSWINDFKVSYENAKWNPSPFTTAPRFFFNVRLQDAPTTFRRGDVLSIGGGTNFQNKGQVGWQVSDDFTYTGILGHTIKVGAKAKWVTLKSLQLNGFNPTYRFFTNVGQPFNDTIPYQFSFQALVGNANPQINSDNFQFGIYAQDDWEVTPRLTLNLGLRWDYERTPAFLNYVHPADQVAAVGPTNYPNLINANYNINDYISTGTERKAFKGAWQPRLGFSWDLDERGRFSIFGGYGRSYDRNQFDFIQQELAQGQAANRTFNVNNPADTINTCVPSPTCVTWNPAYLTPEGRAALVAGLPAGAGRELRFINNDLKMPYSDQFSLGVRGRFGNVSTEVGYSHVASHDGFVYLLGNRRPDGSFFPATGNPDSPFGNPPSPFGSIIIGTNGIETRAHTGYFKLTKSYTRASPWSIDATYTYTKAEENRQFGEVFALDYPSIEEYPFAPSAGIRSHRFVMAATADIPMGLTIAGKFQIASPVWLKRFVSISGTPPVREVSAIEAEGNGDLWGYRQMDLAVTKYVKLRFLTEDTQVWVRADIINLFNDRNYNGFSNVTGLRNTSLATDGPPRTFKLSTGFSF